jgi:hypothetical protein
LRKERVQREILSGGGFGGVPQPTFLRGGGKKERQTKTFLVLKNAYLNSGFRISAICNEISNISKI